MITHKAGLGKTSNKATRISEEMRLKESAEKVAQEVARAGGCKTWTTQQSSTFYWETDLHDQLVKNGLEVLKNHESVTVLTADYRKKELIKDKMKNEFGE